MEARMPTIDDEDDEINAHQTIPPRPYFAQYIRGKNGQFLANFANALIFLRHDPKFVGKLGYDEMLNTDVWLSPVHERITDGHVRTIWEYIQVLGGLSRIGIDVIHHAVSQVCLENKFHPVKDFLNSIEWDGIPRCGHWLVDCLGCQDTEYYREIGKMYLIQMVGRVMKPGSQADYMLVLEGAQGIGKSSACRILFGKWYSEHLPDLSKDYDEVAEHLTGCWGVCIDELHAFSRAETSHLKSFLTHEKDRYRVKYARRTEEYKRQCNFIGTTNQELYLKDETGNRRIWPVKCGFIDLNKLKLQRPQLLAESLQHWRDGKPSYPDAAFEEKHIKDEQKKRQEFDEWQNLIKDYIDRLPDSSNGVRMVALYNGALGFVDKRMSAIDQGRLSKILNNLEWKPKTVNNERKWYHKDNPIWRGKT